VLAMCLTTPALITPLVPLLRGETGPSSLEKPDEPKGRTSVPVLLV
jgi:hypothetical protein